VDAACKSIEDNRRSPSSNRRFWELSDGLLRCGRCGYAMRQDARVIERGAWYYLWCTHRWQNGKDVCSNAGSINVSMVGLPVW
jgi:hypothetical protein